MENKSNLSEEDLALLLSGRLIVDAGQRFYYNEEGELHREDGPAVVLVSGYQAWYQDGLRHRANGPAFVDSHGAEEWFYRGLPHREDGPAISWPNSKEEFWLNGKQVKPF